jgi:hypothetical protein
MLIEDKKEERTKSRIYDFFIKCFGTCLPHIYHDKIKNRFAFVSQTEIGLNQTFVYPYVVRIILIDKRNRNKTDV